jgi:hypothetical protein
MTSASEEKIMTFEIFFSIQGKDGGSKGPDPENRVGDQDTGNPGRPVSFRSVSFYRFHIHTEPAKNNHLNDPQTVHPSVIFDTLLKTDH